MPEPVCLNIGAADTVIPGYAAIDRKFGSEAYPLSVEDGTVDVLRASHILEHFPYEDVPKVVKHWVSKLKPGGMMKISVPDIDKCYAAHKKGELNLQFVVMGGHQDKSDYHGAIFDKASLGRLMVDCGLVRIQEWESEINDCAALPISTNLLGFRAEAADMRPQKTIALLSCPRFGPIIHATCAFNALMPLGIPYKMHQGAYWHLVLSELMESHLDEYEYIITCDYDTAFHAGDVGELYRLMRAYPDIDAICGVQMKRTEDKALFTVMKPDGTMAGEISARALSMDVLPIHSGHFGLTILRTSSLKRLPRPWMVGTTNADGRWADGKIDPDVEFWIKWKAAGLKLCLAPKVVLGHIQEMVTWPDRMLRPMHQTIKDYQASGIPAGVIRC